LVIFAAVEASTLIDPPHSVLQGKLIGFVFRQKNFVEPIVM
jgi:hypothetical protein